MSLKQDLEVCEEYRAAIRVAQAVAKHVAEQVVRAEQQLKNAEADLLNFDRVGAEIRTREAEKARDAIKAGVDPVVQVDESRFLARRVCEERVAILRAAHELMRGELNAAALKVAAANKAYSTSGANRLMALMGR